MEITPTELALIAPFAVILGGYLTALYQRSLSKQQLRAQRKLAADQRLWDKEFDLYEALERRAEFLQSQSSDELAANHADIEIMDTELITKSNLYCPPEVTKAFTSFAGTIGAREGHAHAKQVVSETLSTQFLRASDKEEFERIIRNLLERLDDKDFEINRQINQARAALTNAIKQAMRNHALD